ncbi:hypothetical protein [Cellulosilyticum ruminicola]|nr:hypothetical protein [Cellulosilyticum ruminicola]
MTSYATQIKENLLGIIEQMNDYQWLTRNRKLDKYSVYLPCLKLYI